MSGECVELEAITRLATEFRNLLATHPKDDLPVGFRYFPLGACGDASLVLGRFLRDQGFGSWRYMMGIRENDTHAWLSRDGLIIDITADQYADFPHGPVFISSDVSWHEGFRTTDMYEADFDVYPGRTADELRSVYKKLLAAGLGRNA